MQLNTNTIKGYNLSDISLPVLIFGFTMLLLMRNISGLIHYLQCFVIVLFC